MTFSSLKLPSEIKPSTTCPDDPRIARFFTNQFDQSNKSSYNNILKVLLDPQTCGPLCVSCSPIYAEELIKKGPWQKIGFAS